ncbi:hypothetical protein SAZ11_03620 [Streptomyces sp. FXJ1.4098]|nr:hypothetical protein [Streptomyces sp. FXJ1.4098]
MAGRGPAADRPRRPFALPALVTAVGGAAPQSAAGAAGGLLNAARQAGASLGVATMGAPLMAGGTTRASGTSGATGAFWAFLMAAVACAATGIWFGRPPTADRPRASGISIVTLRIKETLGA